MVSVEKLTICYVLELLRQPLRHRCDTRRHNSVRHREDVTRASQPMPGVLFWAPPGAANLFPKLLEVPCHTIATPLRYLISNFWP